MRIELTGYRPDVPLVGPAADADAGTATDLPVPGGPARVWSGRRLSDGLAVALKLFHAADQGRATREAALAAAVDHPHVLPVLEVATGPQVVALVTPLAVGGSLAALVAARRRLRWPEALTVLIPLADALAAAHERDIVHGDLSAGNVLFDGDGRPLLADLGAARAASECGVTVAVTPTDVAPEIARGADPAPAADLFSLGSVGLRCLSGSPAWPADDLQDVLIQSAAGQWPDPDDLLGPPELLAIIRRLLDPEPARRGSAAQAAVELRRVGDPEPVELVTRSPDGAVSGPPPATVVRSDALRPPSIAGQRRSGRRRAGRRSGSRSGRPASRLPGMRRSSAAREAPTGRHQRARLLTRVGSAALAGRRRGGANRSVGGRHGSGDRQRRHRWWPAVLAVAVVLLLGVGAARAGWWWAGWGSTAPAAVAELPVTGTGGETPSSTPASVTDRASAAATSAAAAAAGGHGAAGGHAAAAGHAASDSDWLTVVSMLDAARARALTDRDPVMLDEVYTAGAPARAADARQISTMRSGGYHVTAARHHVRSVTVVGVGDDGSVTVRVTETLPSYPVLNDSGTVVGSTTATRSVVTMELRPTDDGFRISRLRGT